MYSPALQDIVESCRRWRLWLYMAWFQTRMSYRGSVLGPFWMTLSMAIFVAAMGVVYSKLFHQDMKDYLPFLLCGFINWYLISGVVNDCGKVFINSSHFITQMKLPFVLHVLINMSKHMITYLHNFIVYLLLLLIFRLNPGWVMLLALPGMLLLLLNLTWLSLFLGMVSARFRDIPPIVASIVQVSFFISPITWMPKLIGKDSIIIKLNPITYLLDVVRDPLLGIVPPWYSWLVLIGLFILGASLTFVFFAKYKNRIPFWVL